MKTTWTFSFITTLVFAHTVAIDHMIGTTQITLIEGDITQQKVDAIVNAANEDLSHGGGVARAISNAAGKGLQEYSDQMPIISNGERCPMGKAVITPAFDLEKIGIKKIIHATGPRGTTPGKEQLLYDTYTSSLQIAKENDLKSIAFPAISTAIFGYDINDATPIALKAIQNFVIKYPQAFDEIIFVVFSQEDFAVYQKYISELLHASTSDPECSQCPFKNRALNVLVWGSLGTVFSIISYHSMHAIYHQTPRPHNRYGFDLVAAIACWTLAADNLSELYKDYKRKFIKTIWSI